MDVKSAAQLTPRAEGSHNELLLPVGAGKGLETLAAGEINKDKAAEAELVFESRTVIVKAKLPLAPGVPAMIPVEELTVRPFGSWPPVTLQEYGATPPFAASVAE
jgi:hypothetical protein